MKSCVTLFFMCVCLATAFAQIKNFRISASANATFIPAVSGKTQLNLTGVPLSNSPVLVNVGFIREEYEAQPGFNLKTSFDCKLSNRFFITSGLAFSYLRFNRTIFIDKINGLGSVDFPQRILTGSPITQFFGYVFSDFFGTDEVLEGLPLLDELNADYDDPKIGNTAIAAFQIPVMIGASIFKKKISLRAGVVGSYIVDANTYELNFTSVEKISSTERFTSFSVATQAQIDFNITKGFAFEISGQLFFTPLYRSKYQVAGKAMINTVSAGLSFKL